MIRIASPKPTDLSDLRKIAETDAFRSLASIKKMNDINHAQTVPGVVAFAISIAKTFKHCFKNASFRLAINHKR